MAGESPDKTEQRKSSGTAAEERDPRFAVFRDPDADTNADAADKGADSGTGADSGLGAGADTRPTSDTATAVFRPRLPEDAARREPEAEAPSAVRGPEAEPEAGSESSSGAEETESEPESAAVAASTAPEGATTPPEGAGAAEGRTSPDTDAETPDAQVPDAETPDAETPDAETPAEESAKGSADGSADEPADEAEAEAGDGRLRAAVAAWVDAAAEDKPAADTESDADSDAEPEVDSKDASSATAEAKPKAESKAEPEAEPEPEADEKPESESKGEPDDKAKPGPDADTADTDTAPEPAADDADDASDLRGIDQPTAIFKAVKPAEHVDQATTALKLPPRESEPEDKNKSRSDEAGSKPESDVERTSTFVPLRSDDVRSAPAPRKPEPEAEPDAGSDAGSETSARTPETVSPAAPAPAAPSWAAAERTRQQPLPPRPPLDLLAELTNTPPPPETPVRTAVRRVKIWTPLVLLLLIVFAIVQVMRPLPEPSLELTAKPTYTFEGGATKLSWPGQGQSAVMVDGVGSLGSEGAQKPAPIASVAKVMTAYVILEGHPLKGDEEGETITVDQKAEDESKRPDESTAPLSKGQKLTQRQMLQLLMIPSGNNAARLLARWDAGSEEAFIEKMNEAAKDLGMTGSTYTDPSGLEKTTVSTATDQLKLAQAVMRNEVFRKIVDMPEVEIEGIDGKIYNNNNLLLQPGVSGIKTGSSTPAGGNLLWSANTKVDGKVLWIYGAVMGQQAGTGRVYDSLELSLQNSLKLIKDAQEAATSATVVKKGDVVGYVDNGFGGRTPVVATKNLKAVGWSGLEVELKVTDNGKGIDRAAKAGSEVGMVTVGTGTGKVTAPVVLQADLAEPAFGDKLTRIG
ncbi:serine hydrolase [Streptomyces sp. SID14515]|uniref:serine hydrolase n=1 Tax=Streptomyces sp. SID14515 TaxID=2706074 RepID=UPI0013CBFDF9|nr:D-alanyl-D-alanine carboxypeptidase [Streptomyces sp. SID14515]